MPMQPKSLYDILNVSPDATFDEISQAYTAYAEALIEMQHAHDVLTNEKRRKIYDQILTAISPPCKFQAIEHPETHTPALYSEISEPLFFDPPQPTCSKPLIVGFFETADGVLLPSEIDFEDTYVPLICRSPLERIYSAISNYLHPVHTVKRTGIKIYHEECYFCEKRLSAKSPYILVRAPSAIAMANLLTDTLLITPIEIRCVNLEKLKLKYEKDII